MRRSHLVLIVGAFALVPQLALSAERATKAPVAATAVHDWSGLYVGANLGFGVTSSDWQNLNNTTLFGDAVPGDSFSSRLSGLTGGGQVGINFQSGPWVYGVEALFEATDINGPHTASFGAGDDNFDARIRALLLGSARLGYAWQRWFGFLKAGYAAAYVRTSINDGGPPTTGSGKDSNWRSGPAVGFGFEYEMTSAISVGLEYDYIRLDGGTYQLGDATGSYLWDVDLRNVHLVLARLNYRLGSLPR
jgi:outer membrane immunogenic protein